MRHLGGRVLPYLAVLALLSWLPGSARAEMLYFDDITTGIPSVPIPSNYAGFTWDSNWFVASDTNYMTTYGNTYGSPSGEYAAFNAGGVLNVSLTSPIDFDFHGAFVTAWASSNQFYQFSSTSLTVTGYKDDVLIGSVTTALSPDRYDWFEVNLSGVNRLVFTASGSDRWWLLDNFTYSSPIPEPTALTLFGLGTLGLLTHGWRRPWLRRKASGQGPGAFSTTL